MKKPLILMTNDDGYQSEGLQSLRRSLRRLARVVTVAPDRQQSGTSHSLTLHRPLRICREESDLYSVDGTPTDCIMLAVHEILKRKPDLIVSGINSGPNLGDDVHYSGTVSGAVEGALMGVRSVAFSLVVWSDGSPKWPAAADWAQKICRRLLEGRWPSGSVFNVNIPNLGSKEIRGISFTRLGKRKYGDVIFKKKDPRGRQYFWIGGDEKSFESIPGSDCNAVLKKKISITPLQVDLTDHGWLKNPPIW